jgi:hypothetical protein
MNRNLVGVGLLLATLPFAAVAHVSVGVGIGLPVYDYPYYPPPAYVVEAPPPIMQEVPMGPAPQAAYTWYYCPASRAYYPYVQACPTAWQAVPARPKQP